MQIERPADITDPPALPADMGIDAPISRDLVVGKLSLERCQRIEECLALLAAEELLLRVARRGRDVALGHERLAPLAHALYLRGEITSFAGWGVAGSSPARST